MKPYLVDVPVRVNIWIRPECQRKQFEVLKKARPSIMFLQSDGGRNEEEWKAIRENRKIFDTEVDWDCKIYRIYEEKNLGLYTMGDKVSNIIWEHVDRCIFLEDDQIPSVSFFRYCEELLEKYKDDTRISRICGMNHLGYSRNVSSDYFFSKQGSIWGTATWKRCVEMRDREFSYGRDPYVMDLLKKNSKNNHIFIKRAEAYAKNDYYEGHIAGSEFFIELEMYGYHQLQIIPKYNMISNIGTTKNSTHSGDIQKIPRGLRKVFYMKTYELSFPLKHPRYIIPDINYEKARNKIMGYNYKRISLFRKAETVLLLLIHGGLYHRLRDKFLGVKTIEK